MSIGFDNEKYIKLQKEKINERIAAFDNKLYMEFGGKLFDDYHAARVLPGFKADGKVMLMQEMADQIEIIVVIKAADIEHNKIRNDNGLSYDQETLRLIDSLRDLGLYIGSVVITQFTGQDATVDFKNYLESVGIKTYLHYKIDGYPTNVDLIVSENGFGKNDYVETERPLILVTGPGSGSGKMAVCLSQLFKDAERGLKSGYAKFETFPIWNLPVDHPLNLAYEAATAELNDFNIIDPYHFSAYNIVATSYNRDSDSFPVLNRIFNTIYDESPYKSPTDMGVNMVGFCISDEDLVKKAAKDEIIRRYLNAKVAVVQNQAEEQAIGKIEVLMNKSNITLADRPCVAKANEIAEITDNPAACISLPSGELVTGKTSSLLGAASASLLNALKVLAHIDDDIDLISASLIKPVQELKLTTLGSNNPRLHIDEVLIMLSMAATSDPYAQAALNQIPNLKGADMHSSVILSNTDTSVLKNLKINLTSEPVYQTNRLYRK